MAEILNFVKPKKRTAVDEMINEAKEDLYLSLMAYLHCQMLRQHPSLMDMNETAMYKALEPHIDRFMTMADLNHPGNPLTALILMRLGIYLKHDV